jgi:hypothetical protein
MKVRHSVFLVPSHSACPLLVSVQPAPANPSAAIGSSDRLPESTDRVTLRRKPLASESGPTAFADAVRPSPA